MPSLICVKIENSAELKYKNKKLYNTAKKMAMYKSVETISLADTRDMIGVVNLKDI